MKRFLLDHLPKKRGETLQLSKDEQHHALHVLRLREGDEVELLDGQGGFAPAKLLGSDAETMFELLCDTVSSPESDVLPVELQLSVLKSDAMSWAIEKAVELGAQSLRPVLTERTIVRDVDKDPQKFLRRWQKISDQALKQCGRKTRMLILDPCALYSLPLGKGPRWVGDESHQGLKTIQVRQTPAKPIQFLVGPEGGWSPAERKWIRSQYEAVSLGPWILRAETAALYGLSVVAHCLRSGHGV